jgi:transposase
MGVTVGKGETYPMALRVRVVAAYNDGEGSYSETAERFDIGEATVNRWLARLRRTGSVEPDVRGGSRRARLITPEGEEYIRECLAVVPAITMAFLAQMYAMELGVSMSSETMRRGVARLGYTRKKGLYAPRPQAARTSSRNARTSSAAR